VSMVQAVMLSRPNLEKVAKQTDMMLGASTQLQQERVVDDLASNIVLTRSAQRGRQQDQGGTFIVSYESSDPKKAQLVVQSLLDTFMEDSLGMKRTDSGVAQRFLQSQLSEYERKLIEAESRLADFKKSNIGLMPGGQGDYYQRLEAALGELNQLQTRYRQVQDRRTELQRQLAGESPTFGLTGAASGDPVDGQIAAYQARIDQLLVNYTDKHPEVVALEAQIARLQGEKSAGSRSGGTARAAGSVTSTDDLLARSLDMNPVYRAGRAARPDWLAAADGGRSAWPAGCHPGGRGRDAPPNAGLRGQQAPV
jgi:polysaccharide chain length determinant protein (PEP-CTERM system associated)